VSPVAFGAGGDGWPGRGGREADGHHEPRRAIAVPSSTAYKAEWRSPHAGGGATTRVGAALPRPMGNKAERRPPPPVDDTIGGSGGTTAGVRPEQPLAAGPAPAKNASALVSAAAIREAQRYKVRGGAPASTGAETRGARAGGAAVCAAVDDEAKRWASAPGTQAAPVAATITKQAAMTREAASEGRPRGGGGASPSETPDSCGREAFGPPLAGTCVQATPYPSAMPARATA